ncbi:hypothetical protein KUF54_00600 [Comamonas sp. Y33R10-2]|uniref:hypothetical protein n=1 Tax=Comamonas sp. Y33R10-2 TaxID=2853257 RepID=UPI001C5CA3AA|nr:hypothetical protein [Comamonas sp. Y33R10-2]QXZ09812.1 hypothetical protein KUF54_00600 [Comamonas sp. Y33R10-2]
MSTEAMPWQNYISELPLTTQQHAQALRSLVDSLATSAEPVLSHSIFLPDQQNHAQYEDAPEVFEKAYVQLLLPKPLVGEEVPLLFLGYHIATRFTGNRLSQGFLLTDQAVYLQDDFSVLSQAPLPRAFALPGSAQDVPSFVQQLGKQFQTWKDWAKLENSDVATQQQQVLSFLQTVIAAVLNYHQSHATLRRIEAKPIDVAQFVSQHGISGNLLAGNVAGDAKKLGKVSAKFRIPDGETLHLALVDFPLFGGPYGTALTGKAIYSKDLMEDPLRIPLAEADERTLDYSEDGKEMRINGSTALFFPNHIKATIRDELLDLLKQEIRRAKGNTE